MRHLQEDFFKAQFRFAVDAASFHKKRKIETFKADSFLSEWVSARLPHIEAYEETVSNMSKKGGWTVSKFAIVNAQLSDLISGL